MSPWPLRLPWLALLCAWALAGLGLIGRALVGYDSSCNASSPGWETPAAYTAIAGFVVCIGAFGIGLTATLHTRRAEPAIAMVLALASLVPLLFIIFRIYCDPS